MVRRYYVYLLACADGTLYTGISIDPAKRLEKHNAGRGAKYVRGSRLPARLVAVKGPYEVGTALCWESRVKKMPRNKKMEFFQ